MSRVGIAIWAIHEAWSTPQWLLLVPGGIFALQVIFDVGCCGAAGCAPNQQKSYDGKVDPVNEEVVYQEVQ